MVVGIMAVVAQAERKMISARTKAALAAAKARGKKLGGFRGYIRRQRTALVVARLAQRRLPAARSRWRGVVMSGRRPLIKDSFAVLRGSWVRSCLRPGCAG